MKWPESWPIFSHKSPRTRDYWPEKRFKKKTGPNDQMIILREAARGLQEFPFPATWSGTRTKSGFILRPETETETRDYWQAKRCESRPRTRLWRSMTREASGSFTLKPPDQSPSRHHMQTTGWCLALLITRTHSFLNLGMRHVFGNPVSTLILKAGLVSYPSIRIKPSSSQEVWLLAENLLSLLFHSSKLQKWVHFASYLNLHTCESFCFLEEVSVKGKAWPSVES